MEKSSEKGRDAGKGLLGDPRVYCKNLVAPLLLTKRWGGREKRMENRCEGG